MHAYPLRGHWSPPNQNLINLLVVSIKTIAAARGSEKGNGSEAGSNSWVWSRGKLVTFRKEGLFSGGARGVRAMEARRQEGRGLGAVGLAGPEGHEGARPGLRRLVAPGAKRNRGPAKLTRLPPRLFSFFFLGGGYLFPFGEANWKAEIHVGVKDQSEFPLVIGREVLVAGGKPDSPFQRERHHFP